MMTYQIGPNDTILRHNDDGSISSIPPSPTNFDRQVYVAWQADGNTPDPADPVPDPPEDERAFWLEYLDDVEEVTTDTAVLILSLVVRGLATT